MNLLPLLISFLLFVPIAWAAGRTLSPQHRAKGLALLNLAALYPLCVLAASKGVRLHELRSYLVSIALVYALYVSLVLVQYRLLRDHAGAVGPRPWIPILFPIAALVAVRLIPVAWVPLLRDTHAAAAGHLPEFFIGVSYMAFRLSHLAIEVRANAVPRPTVWEYLGFAFFIPTLAVGPINSYSKHASNPSRAAIQPREALLRMLVGFTKYLFLANLLNRITYAGLLFDGYPHPWPDLLVAMFASYLFLYLNFSGYCDMAIGAAALLGVPVTENFNNPFAARNVREFWNRWHITLSLFVRDLVFTPLSKMLVNLLGVRHANHAVALAIVPVFIIIGIWHGLGWNFLVFGLLHAAAVVANHYYTVALKSSLGSAGFARYNRSRLIRALAVVATFTYVSFTIMFFSNSLSEVWGLASLLH